MCKKESPSLKIHFFLIAFLISSGYLLLLPGCGTITPVIKMPELLPDFVKAYKSMRIYAGRSEYKTGIRVREGDFISFIASGEVYDPSSGLKKGPYWMIAWRIGEKGWPWMYGHRSLLRKAEEGGEIIMSVVVPSKSSFYGSFDVDIIVWKKDDAFQITEIMEKMSLEDPANETLKDYVKDLQEQNKILLAEQKASEEVKETKKAISALAEPETKEEKAIDTEKQTSGLNIQSLQEEVKQLDLILKEKGPQIKNPKEVAELNERLQKAFQTLKELEEMRKRPIIIIAAPKDGIHVEVDSIPLYGVVEHEKGIAQFEIMVNNVVTKRKGPSDLQLTAKYPKRIDFSERIPLRDGKNEIVVSVSDVDGVAGKKNISLNRAVTRDQVWAIVIGINKYKKFPHLKYSVNDAREFHRHLTEVNQVPRENIWLLLDEEATLKNIKSVLGTQVRRKAGKNDMVIIYLAGHGATERDAASPDEDGLEKYILPHNADPRDLYASALPMREVAQIFQRIGSERLVFIGDTCYSGASGGRTVYTSGTRANLSGAFLDRLSRGRGRMILTASDANELSIEKDELQHGVFTYYLLEALRGKGDLDGNGFITLDEVYRYVSEKVPQATEQGQHPVKKGEMVGEIVLGEVK
jgi:hypothetical protein